MFSRFDDVWIKKSISLIPFLSLIGKSAFKVFGLVLKRDPKLLITFNPCHIVHRNRLSDLVARALVTSH